MMITDHFLKYFLLCSLLICAASGYATSETCFLDVLVPKELCLTLYVHQNFAYGSIRNEAFVLAPPGLPNNFGSTIMDDWEIVDGLDQNAKLVARAQGLHFVSSWSKPQWYASHNIVFEADSGWNGSSLEVRGPWDVPSPIEWAILGGTGDFTFAQGIVSGKIISEDANTRIIKIYIQALYRPMRKPILG